MSLKLPAKHDVIKAVVKQDSAILWSGDESQDDENWSNYLKTADESFLKFKDGEQPTRFVLRKVLSYDQAQRVQNAQAVFRDGQMQIQMAYIMEEVRQSLTDIENPEYVPLNDRIHFKRDSDGACSKEIVEGLHALGVVMDLFTIRTNATSKLSEDLKKR